MTGPGSFWKKQRVLLESKAKKKNEVSSKKKPEVCYRSVSGGEKAMRTVKRHFLLAFVSRWPRGRGPARQDGLAPSTPGFERLEQGRTGPRNCRGGHDTEREWGQNSRDYLPRKLPQ